MANVRRRRWIVSALVAAVFLLPALYGFGTKFALAVYHFQEASFTFIPLMSYLLASAGFLFLLFWAIAHGMFRDIERPKHDMLQRELELDRQELMERSHERHA